MTRKAQALVDEIATLSKKEREKLFVHILQMIEGEDIEDPKTVEAAWKVEIERRVAEIDSGKAELIDGDQVMREARALLKKMRSKGKHVSV